MQCVRLKNERGEKMKVAIMTQPLGKNYGGIIQAWALQQVLRNAGHIPVTIDRQYDAKGVAYKTARLGKRVMKKILGQWSVPLNFESHFPELLQHTHAFIDQHISMSELVDSKTKLRKHFQREQYDAVIVGSDQTWRPKYSPNIYNYFLDFLSSKNIKRLAYASSFGVDEWEFTKEQTNRCASLIEKFEAISVREKSGVALCDKYFGVEASHVLDPTLLLTKESYEVLYRDGGIPERNGIYTYILDKDHWKELVVKTASQVLDKPLYSNQPKRNISSLSSSNLSDYIMPSLEGWLKGFADADFVITDSFHGTVFSIIFNKPFISLINPERGASRFYSIAEELGITSRLLSEFDNKAVTELLSLPIDYTKANGTLNTLRKRSMSFLYEHVGRISAAK